MYPLTTRVVGAPQMISQPTGVCFLNSQIDHLVESCVWNPLRVLSKLQTLASSYCPLLSLDQNVKFLLSFWCKIVTAMVSAQCIICLCWEILGIDYFDELPTPRRRQLKIIVLFTAPTAFAHDQRGRVSDSKLTLHTYAVKDISLRECDLFVLLQWSAMRTRPMAKAKQIGWASCSIFLEGLCCLYLSLWHSQGR